MFERILLAADGSDESKKAIETAIALATCSHGEILVVHVHEKERAPRVPDDIESRDEAVLLIEAVVDLVKKAGVDVVGDLRVARMDHVAKEILDAARTYGADVIVVGSRGLGPFSELLLGSVAHKVLQLATCPVMVAR